MKFYITFFFRSKHTNQEEYIDKKGVHVVVGHYIGDDIPGKSPPNLTKGDFQILTVYLKKFGYIFVTFDNIKSAIKLML